MKKNNCLGSTFNDWLESELTDKEFRSLFKAEKQRLELGSRLQDIAKERKLSIRKLAKRMKTSVSQVQRLFSDSVFKCSLETLMKFCIAVDCSLEDIFGKVSRRRATL